MTNVEELLRETFAAQVEDQPPLHAAAQRAIAAAHRRRRRRTLAGLLGAGLAVLLGAVGVAALPTGSTGPAPRPAPPPVPSATHLPNPPLAVLVMPDRLVLPDGRAITLGASDVGGVYAVPDGWLAYSLGPEGWARLVRPDGSVRQVLTAPLSLLVARDGRHLVWQDAQRVHTGHLQDGSIVNDASTAAPDAVPVALTDTAVVFGSTRTGGIFDGFDVWRPAGGAYVPDWNRAPASLGSVLGPAPDGHSFLGVVAGAGNDFCLAVLDPGTHLKVTRTACSPDFDMLGYARLSPDNRWLAVATSRPTSGVAETALLDMTTVFTTPAFVARWTGGLGYWQDATTLVDKDGNRTVRLHLGQTAPDPVTMPDWIANQGYDLVEPPTAVSSPAG